MGDHLGSASTIVQTTGTVTYQGRFLPFGGERLFPGFSQANNPTELGFTGHHQNMELGLVYMNARFYVPGVGRFASADTIIPDPTMPQSFNRYSYVYNNPILYNDPSGHCPMCVSAGVSAASDLVVQMIMNYIFDPNVTDFQAAWDSINWFQVLRSGVEGAVGLPGGPLGRALLTAAGDVTVNALNAWWNGDEYSATQALTDFAGGIASSLIGDGVNGLINKYGGDIVQKGLQKLQNVTGINFQGSIDSLGCPLHSFEASTLVSTRDGLIPIEQIAVGDVVLAYDEKSGEVGYYPVLTVWEHVDTMIVTLTINGEVVETTPWHPFYTDSGWQEAEDLAVGSLVLTANGSYGVVGSVEIEVQPQVMYDLTVDVVHTYFVGDGQWLVHNCGDPEDIIRSIPTMGVPGDSPRVRAVQGTVSDAQDLFNDLTVNATKIDPTPDGMVAQLPGNHYITFRAQSSHISQHVPTVYVNSPLLNNRQWKVKFVP